MTKRIDFTAEQIIIGRAMRRNGKSWGEVGALFGVAPCTAQKCVTGVDRLPRAVPRGVRRASLYPGESDRPTVSDAVLAEREHRLSLTRSLTAEFFGDPLPGYSALDRSADKTGATCDNAGVDVR